MKKLLFIDIDGTLLNNDLKLSDADRDAFLLAKNDNDIFITTGRNYYDIPECIKSLHDSFICLNGSFIIQNQNIVRELTIPSRNVKKILQYFIKEHIEFYLETNKGNFCSLGYKSIANQRYKEYLIYHQKDINQSVHQYDSLMDAIDFETEHVYRISYLLNTMDQKNEIQKLFPSYQHIFWGGKEKSFGELSAKGISKGSAVRYITKQLGYKKKNTIGIGDSSIDIPMFEAVGLSIAMGNAKDEIKEFANMVTESVDNHGVAAILTKIKEGLL